MTGKVLQLDEIMRPDNLGCHIANYWMTWNMARQSWVRDQEELRKYVYATDTTTTSNSKLPWKNSTTIPKLCQIRDNLYSNYYASIFPSSKRVWMNWDANTKDANEVAKRDAIIQYMSWTVVQDRFKTEMAKCILDYIDYGNVFGTVEWVDERSTISNPAAQVGYVGPTIRRICPLDIVFNPTAPSFTEAPKIIRSLISIGELKQVIESESTSEDHEAYQDLYNYLVDIRSHVKMNAGVELNSKDAFYRVDGFQDYRSYLDSDYVEILTFYGDIFDWETKTLLKNYKIMVADRHKVISKKPNPSFFGFPPIFHVGWRVRQDNLWAMGPLHNLVGMQYRVDHIENLKADVFDLLTFPPLKVRGYVEDFKWGPFERIYVGEEGDVEILAPPVQILQANIEIQYLTSTMEEMAGSPKEAMGFRTPGEKTAFEVQRLENAAARIFANKIVQFEEQFVERLLNAMLEQARRNLDGVQSIPVFDDEFKIQIFTELTPADITGAGRLKPMAARHFAEKAEMVQNINGFYQSGPGQDPEVRNHISSIGIAKLAEDLLGLGNYGLVQPNIRVSERQETQRLMQAAQESVAMEAMTPKGLTPDDADPEVSQDVMSQMGMGMQ
jgi:hypothetical protein